MATLKRLKNFVAYPYVGRDKNHDNQSLARIRYRYMVMQTIGFAIYFGLLLLNPLVKDGPGEKVFFYVATIGGGIMASYFFAIRKVLNYNPETEKVLNDELYRLNQHRSAKTAFRISMVTLGLLFIPSLFLPVPPYYICAIGLFVGIMAYQIARLVYNRQ